MGWHVVRSALTLCTDGGITINMTETCPNAVAVLARRSLERRLLCGDMDRHHYLRDLPNEPCLEPLRALATRSPSADWSRRHCGLVRAIVGNGIVGVARRHAAGLQASACYPCCGGPDGTLQRASWGDCRVTRLWRRDYDTADRMKVLNFQCAGTFGRAEGSWTETTHSGCVAAEFADDDLDTLDDSQVEFQVVGPYVDINGSELTAVIMALRVVPVAIARLDDLCGELLDEDVAGGRADQAAVASAAAAGAGAGVQVATAADLPAHDEGGSSQEMAEAGDPGGVSKVLTSGTEDVDVNVLLETTRGDPPEGGKERSRHEVASAARRDAEAERLQLERAMRASQRESRVAATETKRLGVELEQARKWSDGLAEERDALRLENERLRREQQRLAAECDQQLKDAKSKHSDELNRQRSRMLESEKGAGEAEGRLQALAHENQLLRAALQEAQAHQARAGSSCTSGIQDAMRRRLEK
ncbi:unnamed protein product, partial [Prorocentrum cordatum]